MSTRSRFIRSLVLGIVASGACGVVGRAAADERMSNNVPFFNSSGTAATYSTAGFVDLGNEFHTPQGSNGRTCQTCHLPQAGWSVRPIDVEFAFALTSGKHPLFNPLDANSASAKVSSLRERYAAYSMLRQGLFRRGGNVPTEAEYEIVAFDDPLRAGASATHFEFFRRPLATANFHIAQNVGWHDQNTNGSGDVPAGLAAQAAGAIVGAEQGAPPVPAVAAAIAAYEGELRFAQRYVFGVGSLTRCGGRGGPENLSLQPPVRGRFDLYDAWIDLAPGSCADPGSDRQRAAIARGQELFNATNPNGSSCLGCHNAANNGSNIEGRLFDVGTSRASVRRAGMPLYTLRNKATSEIRQTTDPGRALRTGRWADLDRFKVPSLRGLASRPPYFHNGVAATLPDVIRHYETALGFKYTRREREDLAAFLESL